MRHGSICSNDNVHKRITCLSKKEHYRNVFVVLNKNRLQNLLLDIPSPSSLLWVSDSYSLKSSFFVLSLISHNLSVILIINNAFLFFFLKKQVVISLSNLPKITQSVNTELRTSHVPAGVAMAAEATRSHSLWSEDQKAWIKCRQGHSPSERNGKDSAEALAPGLRVPWPWLCDSNLARCPPCLPVSRGPHFNT